MIAPVMGALESFCYVPMYSVEELVAQRDISGVMGAACHGTEAGAIDGDCSRVPGFWSSCDGRVVHVPSPRGFAARYDWLRGLAGEGQGDKH